MATREQLIEDFADHKYATGEKFARLINSMKVVQEPVETPAASGTSLSFIDSIEQDKDGKITATKKTVMPTVGSFRFVANDATAEAALTTYGATYSSAISGVSPSADTTGVILLMNDDDTTPTKTMMIATQSDGNNGYQFVYVGDLDNAVPSGVLTRVDVADNLNTDDATKVLSAKQGKVLSEIPLVEGYRYVGGSTVGTSTIRQIQSANGWACAKLDVKENMTFAIRGVGFGTSALVYYLYDADGILTRVATPGIDGTVNPIEITVLQGEKTLIVNLYMIDNPYSLSLKNIGKTIVDFVPEINKINNDIASINNSVDGIVNILNVSPGIDNWRVPYFIKTDGTLGRTSGETQKVGSLDISDFTIVKFNFSAKPVAPSWGSKYGWCVLDADGNVVAQSDAYNALTDVAPTDYSLTVEAGYKTLLISYFFDYTTPQYVKGIINLSSLKNKVDTLQTDVDSILVEKEYNIENKGVQSYMAVKYDNNDYSYTDIDYAIKNGTFTNIPDFFWPLGVTIETPVSSTATSRTLEYADNRVIVNGFLKNCKTIELDTTSDTYTIYNLLPNKTYYYRIYKDGDTSSLIKSGSFKTVGQLRALKIEATQNYTHSFIDNVRDVGGWKTDSGKSIRYGIMFRGNQLNELVDNSLVSYISTNGINELKNIVGVNAELDFREVDYGVSALGNDVAYVRVPIDLAFYRINIYITASTEITPIVSALRQLIQWLKQGKKVYAHCAGGCDRTGVFYACIEGICGVSENDINKDYELSNRYRNREYYLIANGDNYDGDFKFAMEYIKGLIEYNNHIYVYYRNNYYDAEAVVSSYTPVPLTDAALVTALENCELGTLKQRFHRLMRLGSMTEKEMEELEYLICV